MKTFMISAIMPCYPPITGADAGNPVAEIVRIYFIVSPTEKDALEAVVKKCSADKATPYAGWLHWKVEELVPGEPVAIPDQVHRWMG